MAYKTKMIAAIDFVCAGCFLIKQTDFPFVYTVRYAPYTADN